MKNFKPRILIALLTVVAVILTSCGIGLFVYANAVPDPVVMNDGSGTGKNKGPPMMK